MLAHHPQPLEPLNLPAAPKLQDPEPFNVERWLPAQVSRLR